MEYFIARAMGVVLTLILVAVFLAIVNRNKEK